MAPTGELFEKLTAVIARLRDPNGGCPWDLEQTHATLKPYLIEEAYETIEAIDRHPEKLPEELGDVLLQVVLHAQVGRDGGAFTIDTVVEGLTQKLISRHPHVFGEAVAKDSKQVLENWEALKKKERPADQSILSGVPTSLPGLLKAQRIGEKVARVGFDWADASGVADKVTEELEEFLEARANDSTATRAHLEEELGDLLFSLVQFARKLGLDAEDCLQRGNAKFIGRFKKLETLAGPEMKSLGLERLSELWNRVKDGERE
jgi:MazG family protein